MEPIGKISFGSMISKICRISSATKVGPSILNVDEMKSFYPGLFGGFVNWIWAKSTTLCLDLDLWVVFAVWTIDLGMMLIKYILTKKDLYIFLEVLIYIKISKFQNEFMKSSFLPKYAWKIVRISFL